MKIKNSINYTAETLAQVNHLYSVSWPHSLYILARTLLQMSAAVALYQLFPNVLTLLFAIYIIGVRQASLYDLNHEASHYKIHPNKPANKIFSWLFCIFPFFHHLELYSEVQWRRMHDLHHKYAMTDKDPNYLERLLNGETERPILGWDLALLMLKTVYRTSIGFFLGRQDYISPAGLCEKRKHRHLRLLLPLPNDPEMNRELAVRWCGYIGLLALVHGTGQWQNFFLFWLLPMYTVFPASLKLMDFMDHQWADHSGDVQHNCSSRHINRWVHWLVSDCYRFYHREHHIFPRVPCWQMPTLIALLDQHHAR